VPAPSRFLLALAATITLVGVVAPISADASSSRPARPTGVQASSGHNGTYLTWSGSAARYAVTQATDSHFNQHRRTYIVRGHSHQFTPYGLNRGTTYYFRVRALSGSSHSPYSSMVRVAPQASEMRIRVMTYNIMKKDKDGHREGGNTIAPWSQRRPAAIALIRQADPGILTIQEGGPFVGRERGPRQVDDLRSHLGNYALAHTEVPPSQPHYFRTGCYVLYKPSVWSTVGGGNHWNIGDTRWAAYQLLQSRRTGARVLVISPHLTVGVGSTRDQMRERETNNLLALVRRNFGNVATVYAGDFNSHSGAKHPLDGPAVAMRAAHVADAFTSAQTRVNKRYNSANGYLRTPPAAGVSIDHIYASPGVAIRTWHLFMRISHGHLVGTIPSDHDPLVSDLVIPR
jgi:endonuclease/exonuclease/phosphatase family metal-dependent hydrolase